ncbi:polyamine ABC transporter substrate-binding protein [Phenylobacterium deserti]|uniref:Putrescine-binding periplasmic protein n=1 Tax=Phenylobacterium deserti TaxID=1914756 RepID=A0A328A8D9_9CAUL|nr:polyamine ABC transporter substrate-binding protein [Phenylobacterium deserti]RAK50781.1 spermidine/putrescine ABC transporter substrate-binding protein PotF [Phenylobacterium deserti]
MQRWVRTLGWAAAAAVAMALTACGNGGAGKGAGELRIYNWSDYIDPALLEQFTAETGVKVRYDTFDSNEVLETKVLQGNTGYDLVVPSNHNVPRYIAAGAIGQLDKSKIAGLSNLAPNVLAHMEPFDPGQAYTVPYMQGTIGIGYNADAVAARLPGQKIDSWAVVFDPANLAKLKECGVYFLDASEDMYAVALNYLGRDPNSKVPADYAAATDLLLKARPFVRKFHSSEYIDALANGDICVAIGYSGDVLQAQGRAAEAKNNVKVAYAIPREGTQVWFDVFAIPADAPNKDAAYRFLSFMMRPEIIAKASNYTRYANANSAATPLVDAQVRNDPNIYPPKEVASRFFVTTAKDQALLRDVNRQWTRVLTGQ